jgi:hypothetical protein
MPAERVSMRRVREILRLKYEAGASDRAIARSVGVARSTARLCLDRVAAAGLTWPLPEGLTDGALEALLFASSGAMPGQRRKAEPDWVAVHRELRRPGVTLMLGFAIEFWPRRADGFWPTCRPPTYGLSVLPGAWNGQESQSGFVRAASPGA